MRAAAVAGLAAVLLLVETGASSPGAGRIAFVVNRAGAGEIWTMRPDGSDRRQLSRTRAKTSDAAGDHAPAWSPDGSRIAFASTGAATRERGGDLDLAVMRADGGGSRLLARNPQLDDTSPAWSPDGSVIVFARIDSTVERGNPRGWLSVVHTDGGGLHRITWPPPHALDWFPSWHRGGGLIAFTRARLDTGRRDVYVVRPSGAGVRLLIPDALDPAWSPNGRRIVFVSTRDRFGKVCFEECSPSGEIYVADADGRNVRRLTHSPANDGTPAWSPDGRLIVFSSHRADRNQHLTALYTIPVAGGTATRIGNSSLHESQPDWR